MLVAAAEAVPLRSLERLRVELDGGVVSLIGPNGAGKTNFLEARLLRAHRPFLPDRRPPRPDPVRRRPRTCGGHGSRRGWDRTHPARLGLPHRGPPPPARRQPGGPGDDRPPPAPGRGLLPGPAGAGQGPAVGAPGSPRRVRRRPLATPRRAAPALRPGSGAAQRAAAPARGRWRQPGAARPLGRDPRRGRRSADRWRGREAVAELSPSPSQPPPRSSASAPSRRSSTRRGPSGSAAEIRAGLAERRDADLRLGRSSWGPHLDELKLAAAASRCGASARRASSGRPCWR